MSHTPGPWKLTNNGFIWEAPDGYEVGGIADADEEHGGRPSEDRANARLIVVAPEMFQLIRRINAHLVRPDLLGDLIDDAEKLIAKAEGAK